LAAIGIGLLVGYFFALRVLANGLKYRIPVESVLIVTTAARILKIASLRYSLCWLAKLLNSIPQEVDLLPH